MSIESDDSAQIASCSTSVPMGMTGSGTVRSSPRRREARERSKMHDQARCTNTAPEVLCTRHKAFVSLALARARMGCGASQESTTAHIAECPPMQAQATSVAPQAQADPDPARKAKRVKARAAEEVDLLAHYAEPNFEMSTAMVVQPFIAFQEQGRIFKSIRAWREEAFKDGRLVVYADAVDGVAVVAATHEKMSVIFISHSWWDREYRDEASGENGASDQGAPDYQRALAEHPANRLRSAHTLGCSKATTLQPLPPPTKDLKHQIICAGVATLMEQRGLLAEDLLIWIDWQSISQDDEHRKLQGIMSLIRYATLCTYMLVPTEEEKFVSFAFASPENIMGYGERGWCRAEYFAFYMWSQMVSSSRFAASTDATRERDGWRIQLYAIKRNGALTQYVHLQETALPSGGMFSQPQVDRPLIRMLEDRIIEANGRAVAVAECYKAALLHAKARSTYPTVFAQLPRRMLRAVHMEALGKGINKYKVSQLDLSKNQLGADGGIALGKVLLGCGWQVERRGVVEHGGITSLSLADNQLGDDGVGAICEAVVTNEELKLAALRIQCNDVGAVGAKAVAAMVGVSCSLRLLWLGGNERIGDEGVTAICEAVKGNKETQLATLALADTGFGPAGAKAVAAMLAATPSLTDLDVRRNHIHDSESKRALKDANAERATPAKLQTGR